MQNNRRRFTIACATGITAAVATITIGAASHADTGTGSAISGSTSAPSSFATAPQSSSSTSSGSVSRPGDDTPHSSQGSITTSPGPCTSDMKGLSSMRVTYRVDATEAPRGTFTVRVASKQAAAGQWTKRLGHLPAKGSRTVTITWPSQYEDVSALVDHTSANDPGTSVAHDESPSFATCDGSATEEPTSTMPPPPGGSSGLTTRPDDCAEELIGLNIMDVTYAVPRGRTPAGTFNVWVRSKQAATGSWSEDLGHIKAGSSRTATIAWPIQYKDVAVYVGYRSEVDTSETVAYTLHPRFASCTEHSGSTPSSTSTPAPSASASASGTSEPSSDEPPTPSPATTALGVTG